MSNAMALRFEVPGPPVPAGRARVTSRGAYTPERTRAYEHCVAAHAIAAVGRASSWPRDAEYAVTIELWHGDARRRDVDNGGKSVLDGLTRGGVWGDDSQVACLTVRRGLDRERPRAEIRIEVLP